MIYTNVIVMHVMYKYLMGFRNISSSLEPTSLYTEMLYRQQQYCRVSYEIPGWLENSKHRFRALRLSEMLCMIRRLETLKTLTCRNVIEHDIVKLKKPNPWMVHTGNSTEHTGTDDILQSVTCIHYHHGSLLGYVQREFAGVPGRGPQLLGLISGD